jgi:hypothetical protein
MAQRISGQSGVPDLLLEQRPECVAKLVRIKAAHSQLASELRTNVPSPRRREAVPLRPCSRRLEADEQRGEASSRIAR